MKVRMFGWAIARFSASSTTLAVCYSEEPTGGLRTHQEPALVLRRGELLGNDLYEGERGREDQGGGAQDGPAVVQQPAQQGRVAAAGLLHQGVYRAAYPGVRSAAKKCEQRIGVSVRASSSESMTAAVIVTPNRKKNCR